MNYPRQNQHHVSRALLKQFEIPGEEGMVYQFDKCTGMTRKRPISRVESSSKDFPYWTEDHESYMKELENNAIPLIRRLGSTKALSSHRYQCLPITLTSAERRNLMRFIAMLDVTADMVRRYRSKGHDGRNRLANELRSFGLSSDPSTVEDLYHDIPKLSRGRIENWSATHFSTMMLQIVRISDGLVVLPDIPVGGRFVIAMPPPSDHFVLPLSPNNLLLGCCKKMVSYFACQYVEVGLPEALCGEPHSRYIYSSEKLSSDFRGRSIWVN